VKARKAEAEEEEARKADDDLLAMEEGRYNEEVDASNDTRTSYGEGDIKDQALAEHNPSHVTFYLYSVSGS
jgi:redox-sensitive bicupin YhaK (pirin superfamily)